MCDPNFASNTRDLAIRKSGHFHHSTETLPPNILLFIFVYERTSLAAFIPKRFKCYVKIFKNK